jgi:hypothetical protein
MIPTLDIKEKIKKFCERYLIKIIDANRRVAITWPLHPTIISYTDPDHNEHHDSTYRTQHDTEPLYTIQVPQSKLNAIAEVESIFYNNIDHVGHRRVFEAWMAAQEEDNRIRNKYPAVRQAYEQYMLLLRLSREKANPFKELDDA